MLGNKKQCIQIQGLGNATQNRKTNRPLVNYVNIFNMTKLYKYKIDIETKFDKGDVS